MCVTAWIIKFIETCDHSPTIVNRYTATATRGVSLASLEHHVLDQIPRTPNEMTTRDRVFALVVPPDAHHGR